MGVPGRIGQLQVEQRGEPLGHLHAVLPERRERAAAPPNCSASASRRSRSNRSRERPSAAA